MLLVDLDAAGVERRPIALASGREELAEVFFTDVVVDAERVIGTDGGGWAVAMDLLQYERGTYAWMRMATATAYLQQLLRALNCTPAALDSRSAAIVGRAYLNLAALRARTADTLGKLASNVTVGSETSVDKLLLSTAEQDVLDAAMSLLGSGRADLGRRERDRLARPMVVLAGRLHLRRRTRSPIQHRRRPNPASSQGECE